MREELCGALDSHLTGAPDIVEMEDVFLALRMEKVHSSSHSGQFRPTDWSTEIGFSDSVARAVTGF